MSDDRPLRLLPYRPRTTPLPDAVVREALALLASSDRSERLRASALLTDAWEAPAPAAEPGSQQ